MLTAVLLVPALLSLWLSPGQAAQLPVGPQAFIDTTYSPPSGNTFNVSTNAQFTSALNSSVPGDTIVLQAGTTFTGPFTLPNKSGAGWIYIRTSAYGSLPPPGTRVTPADATNMPKITVGAASGSAIETNARAHHFRFVGIEFRPPAGTYVNTLVSIGNGELLANLPQNIIFDRCYVHGDPAAGGRRGLALNGNAMAVIDSYISDFKENGADTQAVWGYNGAGPFKIVNNYLEASGENVMFGGADPSASDLVPSDIEIRRNHFFKPLTWMTQAWTVKNLMEFKNARRVLVEGNVFENNWFAAQAGFAVQLTPRNEDGGAPWSTVEDITIRHNRFLNVGSGFNISGRDGAASQILRRLLIENNELTVTRLQGSDARIFQVINGPIDVTIRHNTGLISGSGGATAFTDNDPQPADQFDFRDNIFSRGSIGFASGGASEGTGTLNRYYTNFTFTKNNIIGASAGNYPPNNFFNNLTQVQFVNSAGGNYRLSASSPLKNQATDGKDVGADIDAIEAAIGGSGPAPGIAAPANLRVL